VANTFICSVGIFPVTNGGNTTVDVAITYATAKSAAAIRYGKTMFYRQKQMELSAAYEYAGDVMSRNMMDADASEGIDAFLGKRRAVWNS